MDYQLTKLSPRAFKLAQSEKNKINIIFNSAKSACNYAKHSNSKNNVFIAGTKVCITDAIAKSLDTVKIKDEIRHSFPDVKSIKFKGDKTTVVLTDGRTGVSIRQHNDNYDKMTGFLYAFKNARIKRLTGKNINTMLSSIITNNSPLFNKKTNRPSGDDINNNMMKIMKKLFN